jgi:mono/diheme cytochrome c family protein/glucose/arabinose dehydrogenase
LWYFDGNWITFRSDHRRFLDNLDKVQPFMRLLKLGVFGILVALTLVRGDAFQTGAWPPAVQQVPAASPPLSVAAAMKTFHLPPGYHLEVVVNEPMIQDPVFIDWDADGRLWVVEMPGYMIDIQAARELEPLGRIVVLEDANQDGKMDKRTVFADGLVLARALKVLDRGVLVGEPPNLWLMRDTNGDLKADAKELVTDQYGRREANVEHNANGLLWALDNWIHTSEVDIYLRLKNGKFEVRNTLARGQWGLSQDDAGRVYRNTNPSALHVDLVQTPYFMRHPNLRRTRGSHEFLGADESLNAVWPARPTRGVNRGYQNGVLRADGTLSSFTAAAAPTVFRGDRLPPDVYGHVFVAEPSGNLVSRIVVSDDGRTLRGRKAYDRAEFITSTDERFRPVYLSSAPDGTLYVVDMYRGIIQHRGYITEYLRDQILSRKLEQPIGLGRIYRVVHETTRRDRRPALSSAPAARLVDTLSHPNGWWRDTAQRLLVERGDKSVVGALEKLARSAPEARTRLHALWTLDGLDALDPAGVSAALGDASRDVRASAVRLSERWLREPQHPMHAAVLKLVADQDWAVRGQLAASLGELPAGVKENALATFLGTHATDPVAMDAALSGLAGSETVVLERLLHASAETPQRSAAITMLAATIVSTGQDAPVQALLDRIAEDVRFVWQRSAMLRGVEVSLLGATAPGAPAGRGRGRGRGADPAEPCPTCPGGRAGPGGAPAFQRPTEGEAGRGRGRGGASGPMLKLTREPALSAVAARDTGDLGKRAASVLARVEWPGKPGAAAEVAPLTPAEQQRFNAGREVYQNLCVACHQPDGRGREKLAPTLLGAEFALGSPEIPIRILINGKEGPVGLMPPLGSGLSDEQIAAVLTYVRREWSQTGSPVDPATVKEVRPLTAGRTRPWTADELAKIATDR